MAAHPGKPSKLLELPLELKGQVFKWVSARDFSERSVLQRWFERKDIEQKIAFIKANNPDCLEPRPYYIPDNEPIVDDDVESDDDEDAGSERESDDSDMDEDEYDYEADEMDEDGDEEDSMDEDGDEEEDEEDAMNQDGDDESDMEEDLEQDGADIEEELAEDDEDDLEMGEYVHPHPKWAHVPKFLRLTKYPPPPELLGINKALSEQALSWFSDVAVLEIDVTVSFVHASFFLETLLQIGDAAFSPLEKVKKAKIEVVWDSLWVRASDNDFVVSVFPAELRGRIDAVKQLLMHTPSLEAVTIEWFDSTDDPEAQMLVADICEPFLELSASIEVKQTIQEPGVKKPGDKSFKRRKVGKLRAEFQEIINARRGFI
ncbi:unnamed protein product [Periconia digitata]|uniref:Uncharacterized protein n=1 Tax=Periconia digitata TaxID=1303443 RepID=A0A9W4XXB0_9PLEO|nr:unnamed protein product [Periconia digitata]